MVGGLQQAHVYLLMKRQAAEQVNPDRNIIQESFGEVEKCSPGQCCTPGAPSSNSCSLSQNSQVISSKTNEHSSAFAIEATCNTLVTLGGERTKTMCGSEARKKSKRSSQLSLRSFFQKSSISSNSVSINTDISTSQRNVPDSNHLSNETPIPESQSRSPKQYELNSSVSNQDQDEVDACSSDKENSNFALLEWQRLQQVMQNSIPVCKHHSEPCVARVVSKRVPNFGCRFYVCARAEGPASNPEANFKYF